MPGGRADYAVVAERAFLWGSPLCALAALIAFATGEQLSVRGGTFRTHTDATWVLGTLAALLLLCGILVLAERRWQSLSQPSEE